MVRRVLAEGELETNLILAAGADDPPFVSVESDRLALAARRLYERWVAGAELRPHPPCGTS